MASIRINFLRLIYFKHQFPGAEIATSRCLRSRKWNVMVLNTSLHFACPKYSVVTLVGATPEPNKNDEYGKQCPMAFVSTVYSIIYETFDYLSFNFVQLSFIFTKFILLNYCRGTFHCIAKVNCIGLQKWRVEMLVPSIERII